MRRLLLGVWGGVMVLGCTGVPALGPPPLSDPVDLVVFARPVAVGQTVEAADLDVVAMEPRYLPSGIFISTMHVEGRIARMDILQGEYAHASQFADPELGKGMESIIPRGMRSVTVPRADSSARPGSYIDVWWTPPGGEPCAVAQAVFVLGWGGLHRRPSEEASQMQLLLSPFGAVAVLQAVRSDTLRYVTRSDVDVDVVKEVACSP